MQHLSVLLGFVAAATAAPAMSNLVVSTAAAVPEWTIQGFTRTCDVGDSSCTVSFTVDDNAGNLTACAYAVTGSPASRTSVANVLCGPFTIGSGWSGQFGPDHGFTTWSLANWNTHLIAFPSYADSDLVNATAVTPDRSFAVQTLSA